MESRRGEGADAQLPAIERFCFPRLHHVYQKYDIYRTPTAYYVVAKTKSRSVSQLLHIDRVKSAKTGDLVCHFEPAGLCTEDELYLRLPRHDHHFEFVTTAQLIVGFPQFTSAHYMYVVTESKRVGVLKGRGVYGIKKTELLPIAPPECNERSDSTGTGVGSNTSVTGNHVEERRMRGLFLNIDLTDEFYFSYAYDLTNTLEVNMLRGAGGTHSKNLTEPKHVLRSNEYFVWNLHMLEPLVLGLEKTASPWIVPLIHGFFRQRRIGTTSRRTLTLTLVARRSRHFAGPRYLRRGADILGRVANEVETEQILADDAAFGGSGVYTSMVQVRGSIPLHWCHENLAHPKPDILLWKQDKSFQAANLHFDRLIRRYKEPVVVLNLIKQEESGRPKETMLFEEFTECIRYLNGTLYPHLYNQPKTDQTTNLLPPSSPPPSGKTYASFDRSMTSTPGPGLPEVPTLSQSKETERTMPIVYITFDFLTCARSAHQNVLDAISEITNTIFSSTGFFRTLPPHLQVPGHELPAGHVFGVRQEGILRTNCIDCLDRTNVAQFCLGRDCLKQQMECLGVDTENGSSYNLCWQALMNMFAEHGNCMGLQYGGSGAMHSLALEKPSPASNDAGSALDRSPSRAASSVRKKNSATSLNPFRKQSRDTPINANEELIIVAQPAVASKEDTLGPEGYEEEMQLTLTGGAKNALVAVTRYLSNNFSDADKQRSLDLFLGTYDARSGYSGARKDVQRAASRAGGSLFELGMRRVHPSTVSKRCCQRKSDPNVVVIRKVSALVSEWEHDDSAMTSFDEELTSEENLFVVDNIAEHEHRAIGQEDFQSLLHALEHSLLLHNHAPESTNGALAERTATTPRDVAKQSLDHWLATSKDGVDMVIEHHKSAKLSYGDAVEELSVLRRMQVAREVAQEREYHEYVHHNLSSSRAMFSRIRRERG